MKPHGQRMGANDDVAEAEGLDDYDWLDAPMAGLRDEPVRMSATPCGCGQPRRYHTRRCDSCARAARLVALRPGWRRKNWHRLPETLTVRTCACGIVFALKYEEARCSICRARPCDRRDMKVKTCACGARFAAKGFQAWCDGCRLKVRKNNEEETK